MQGKNIKNEIYLYCEKLWSELSQRDGGYYPSKHDNKVMEMAAEKFEISIEEVEKAHGDISYDKAKKETAGMTKDQLMQEMQKIVTRNRETPWGQDR